MVDNKCANIFSKTLSMLNFYIIEIYIVVLTDCAWNVCIHLLWVT